jgi:hypothetical protein
MLYLFERGGHIIKTGGWNMSYEIIKSIKIKEDKVIIKGASNNVRPLWYEEWECKSLSKMLQEQGRESVELEILGEYESGNFQRGNNKFVRALKVLNHMPEYQDFDWRKGWGKESYRIDEARKSDEFKALLKKALHTYLPKDKFIVYKYVGDTKVYLFKVTKRYAKWTANKERAKIFNYQSEAEELSKYFVGGETFRVEKIV